MGQGWRHDIAAAAEHSGAVAQPDRWNPRACQLFMVMDLCSRNIRGPRRQVGPVLKGIRDQIVGGGVQCDQVDRDKRSPRGAEADRGIEIEPVGQSSGSDGDGLLGRWTAARRSFQSACAVSVRVANWCQFCF